MASGVTILPPSNTTQVGHKQPRFIDIGVNLTDPVFRGVYHGQKKHEDDLEAMLARSRSAGVKSMIITGTSLKESRQALILSRKHGLYTTIGCHPTRSKEFDAFHSGPVGYLEALDDLIKNNLEGRGRVVAVGECGLDYDRTRFASPAVQKTHFRSQLALAKKYHLPLFLHSRAAHSDFVKILREEGFGENGGVSVGGKGGVVHSFTGTTKEAQELILMGFHISVNGCSLKTEENIKTLATIKPEFLMLETDAPWCSMTSTHASKAHLNSLPTDLRTMYLPQATAVEKFSLGNTVKGRNEPASIGAVGWVVHKVLGIAISEIAWKNTVEVFGLHDL